MDNNNASKVYPFYEDEFENNFESKAWDIFNDIDLSGCKDHKVINLDFNDIIEEEMRRQEEDTKSRLRNCMFTAIVGGIIFGLAAWKKKH